MEPLKGENVSYCRYLCNDKYYRICTNKITYTSQKASIEVHYINLHIVSHNQKTSQLVEQYQTETAAVNQEKRISRNSEPLQNNYQFHNKCVFMAQMRELLPKLLSSDKLFATGIASISTNCGDHMPVRQKPAPPAQHRL